jgi:hypothetical protein
MAIRTPRSLLDLTQPFVLKAAESVAPAGPGPHEAGTEAEPPNGRSPLADRRAARFIHVHGDRGSQIVLLDADALSDLVHTGVLIPLDSVEPAGGGR